MKKQENLLKENSTTIDGVEIVRNNLTIALSGYHDSSDEAIKLFEDNNWVFSFNLSERQVEIYSLYYGYLAAYIRDSDLHILKKDDHDLKTTLTKVEKNGRHRIEIDNMFAILDGYVMITFGYYLENNVVDVKYVNQDYHVDKNSFKGHVLKTPLENLKSYESNIIDTSTYYFSFNTLEKRFYIRNQQYGTETIPVIKHVNDQSSFHFEIRHSKVIGKTDINGKIKLSTINNYTIPFDDEKKWMIVVDDTSNVSTKKPIDKIESGNIWFFKGLKNIGHIEVDTSYVELKKGSLKMIDDYLNALIELEIPKVKQKNEFKYLYDFAELSVLHDQIYINGEKTGHVEHLQGTYLKPEHRSIIKLSKTYNNDKLKAIKEVVQQNYPDRTIVYYLKEELV